MILVVTIIVVALVFDFINGFHDSANSIATVIATRTLKPQRAVIMAAFANFISAFIFGTAVAEMIGKGIIEPKAISSTVILAGLISACLWNIITWYFGLPTSSSHALIGSLIGSAYFKYGKAVLIFSGIFKIAMFIAIAPLLGFFGAIIFTVLSTLIVKDKDKNKVIPIFRKLQILSSFSSALGHGANDAQKTIGIISLALYTNGITGSTFHIPFWVIASSYATIALGTYFGGWKIIKTMATKIIKLRPFEGFCAEVSSAITLFFVSHFGIPVSTTHVINGSIAGVGAAENYKKVRWITTRKIFTAWILTIPISFTLGVITMMILNLINVK